MKYSFLTFAMLSISASAALIPSGEIPYNTLMHTGKIDRLSDSFDRNNLLFDAASNLVVRTESFIVSDAYKLVSSDSVMMRFPGLPFVSFPPPSDPLYLASQLEKDYLSESVPIDPDDDIYITSTNSPLVVWVANMTQALLICPSALGRTWAITNVTDYTFDAVGLDPWTSGSMSFSRLTSVFQTNSVVLLSDLDAAIADSVIEITNSFPPLLEGFLTDEADPLSVHTSGGEMTGLFKLASVGIAFTGINIETNYIIRAESDGTNTSFNVYEVSK